MSVMKHFFTCIVVALALSVWTLPVNAQTGQFSSFNGLETNAGYVTENGVSGWACYGRTTGALNGNFTLTFDYMGMPIPGGLNTIQRGNWTLPVYSKTIRGDTYMGALYGLVSRGDINWDNFGNATLSLRLTVIGGTYMMEGATGQGQFTATTYFDGSKTAMKGDLTFFF